MDITSESPVEDDKSELWTLLEPGSCDCNSSSWPLIYKPVKAVETKLANTEALAFAAGSPRTHGNMLCFCLLRLKESDEWGICFSVYQPDSVADFKKSNPGKPYSRMSVCR